LQRRNGQAAELIGYGLLCDGVIDGCGGGSDVVAENGEV